MELQTLDTKVRTSRKKGAARKERAAGRIPGVVYGEGHDAVSISLDGREFIRLLHAAGGEHAVVELKMDNAPDKGGPAMLREIQHHPLRGDVLHVDFQRIRLDRKITTFVPVHLEGKAKGLTEGGVLDYQLREVEVECLPANVPGYLELDISDLEIGDSAHVADCNQLVSHSLLVRCI
ncbi:MAG: 50S ribosomal protein L25 [Candidatus Hydrogenedentota bacterium]